jgi:hypothetical protein
MDEPSDLNYRGKFAMENPYDLKYRGKLAVDNLSYLDYRGTRRGCGNLGTCARWSLLWKTHLTLTKEVHAEVVGVLDMCPRWGVRYK